VEIVKVNEFESLAKGLDYLNKNKPEFAFMYSKKTGKINCKSMVLFKKTFKFYEFLTLEKRRLPISACEHRFRGQFFEVFRSQ